MPSIKVYDGDGSYQVLDVPVSIWSKFLGDEECARCRFTSDLTRQHVVPRREGGKRYKNIIFLCRQCHDWVNSVEALMREGIIDGEVREEDLGLSDSKEFKKLRKLLGVENGP